MAVLLLLPAFNEQAALALLLPKVRAVGLDLHVMLVDDGSRDGTAKVAESFSGVTVIRHQVNRGLGQAFRTLFDSALELVSDDDVLVTMDADNSMDPGQIPALVAALSGYDVVIASRYAGGTEGGVPLMRRVYSAGARFLFTAVFHVPGVKDYTCSYRAYRAGMLRRLQAANPLYFDGSGFTAPVEILLNLQVFRPHVREVPLLLHYDEKQGPSKMNVSRTIREYMRLVWRQLLVARPR